MNQSLINPLFNQKPLGHMLDDIFSRSIADFMGADSSATIPSVNISENADAFLLEVAAPGLEKKDFTITVDHDQLVISCSKETETEDREEGKWSRKEFSYHSFKRSFNLSDQIDVEHIIASYEHGILKVTLPKKEEAKVRGPLQIDVA